MPLINKKKIDFLTMNSPTDIFGELTWNTFVPLDLYFVYGSVTKFVHSLFINIRLKFL